MAVAVQNNATSAQALQNQNMLARQLIQASAIDMMQQIYSTTITPSAQSILNIAPRNIGLVKGFIVEVSSTITNTAGAGLVLTDFNVANILSQVTFTDLNNNVRINTSGWHLMFVDSVKNGRVFGSSTPTDSPVKFGSNWNVISAPATIAASGTGTVTMKYWVPLAYSDADYRGAIFANVTGANMNLQLTLNPAPVVATGDSTNAVYSGNPATNTSTTVTVYQSYMDQLPMGKGGAVLPLLDISTVYELKSSNVSGLVPNQEFPIQYSNFRDFLSTFLVYFNGTARATGADISYLALQSANFTNIFKVDPYIQALRARRRIGTDFPPGVYFFDHSKKPISTVQYGNMELVINPITAGAGAYVLIGWEDFGLINTISQAGSLAG